MSKNVIFFDVVETLFSLQPLEESLINIGISKASSKQFFVQLIRDAFALALIGKFHSFPDIAKGSLQVFLKSHNIEPSSSTIDKVLDSLSGLPAQNDVLQALKKLRQFDCTIVLLTNGTCSNTTKLINNNDLTSLVDDVISVDDIGTWKPSATLYQQALSRYACEPENTVLIAAHAWDVCGALNAGLNAIWVERHEFDYHPLMGNPNAKASSLIEAVDNAIQLLQLSANK